VGEWVWVKVGEREKKIKVYLTTQAPQSHTRTAPQVAGKLEGGREVKMASENSLFSS